MSIANSEYLNGSNGSKSNGFDMDEDNSDLFRNGRKPKKQSSTEYLIVDPNDVSPMKPDFINKTRKMTASSLTTSSSSDIANNNNTNKLNSSTTSSTSSSSTNNPTRNNFYNTSSSSSSNYNASSRARLAQENLQRLEREKDDLYEL